MAQPKVSRSTDMPFLTNMRNNQEQKFCIWLEICEQFTSKFYYLLKFPIQKKKNIVNNSIRVYFCQFSEDISVACLTTSSAKPGLTKFSDISPNTNAKFNSKHILFIKPM